MSSGRIAIINSDNKIYTSTRFLYEMEPTNLGEKIIKALDLIDTANLFDKKDFLEPKFFFEIFIKKFNDTYFKSFKKLIKEVPQNWYNTHHDYKNKWNCDYVYIKNTSKETKHFVTPDGFVSLPPNEILTLHFGKVISEDEDKFAHINIGDIVTIADIEWIVLKKNDNSIFCLTKNIISEKIFDKNTPNYALSDIRKYLLSFSQNLKNKLNENFLLPRTIDLATYEGETNYGDVFEHIGLLTETEYKEFKPIIKKYPPKNSWWLTTAFSQWGCDVRCINIVGQLTHYDCCTINGIRPACLFNSSAFIN